MATANKILGQVKPSAASNTLLYTVPASTQANVNIFVANQSSTDTTIRIGLVLSGGSLASTDYIAYDMLCQKDFPLNFTGIALAAGEKIYVYNTLATCSFVASGIEIS